MAVNLKAKLGLESKGFHTGLNKADKGVAGLAARFTKLKGLIGKGLVLGGVGSFVKASADAADEIDNLASRMGTTTRKVQQFQRAADRSGQTIEVVADAYKTLKIRSQEAAAGNKILQDQFTALGISQEELESGNIDAMFEKLKDALTGSDKRVEALAVGMKLLGEPVEKLVPVLDSLDAGVGRVVSDKNIKGLDKLQHNMTVFWEKLKTFTTSAAGLGSRLFMTVTDPISKVLGMGRGYEDPAKQAEALAEKRKGESKSLKDIADAEKAKAEAAAKAKEEAKEQLEITKARTALEKIERQNSLDRLSDEEKLTRLKKEQQELIEKAEKQMDSGKEKEYYETMAQAAQLTPAISNLEQTKKPLGGIRIQQSAMQQAGARIAGVDKRLAQLSAKQLTVQQEILKIVKEGGTLIMGKGGKLNPYTGE